MTIVSTFFAYGGFVLGFINLLFVVLYWRQRQPKITVHVHDWTPWEDTEMEIVSAGILSGAKVGTTFMGQTRQCRECGLRAKKT